MAVTFDILKGHKDFVTSMLNHHADLETLKELLGHESVSTTEIYTHTTFEELKKMYNQAHPRA